MRYCTLSFIEIMMMWSRLTQPWSLAFRLPSQVLSHDQLGKDDFMGEKIIELGRLDWSEVTTSWFELEAEVRVFPVRRETRPLTETAG